MVQIFSSEWWFAFILSVIIGVLGKIAFDIKIGDQVKISQLSVIRIFKIFGMGSFVGFIAYQLVILLELEKWTFVIVPFSVYSSTYVLTFWDGNSAGLLKDIINLILGRINTNLNNSQDEKYNTHEEHSSEDDNSISGNTGELPR